MSDFDTQVREKLKQLCEEMKTNASEFSQEIPEFEVMNTALKELNDLTNKEYSKKDSFGLNEDLSAETHETFKNKYTDAYKACSAFFAKASEKAVKDKWGKIAETSEKVMDLLSNDMRVLNTYHPENEKMSLPELIHQSRTRTIDVTGVELGTAGNMLSSRIPLTFTDPDGTVHTGYFTKESRYSAIDQYRSGADKIGAALKDEKYAEAMKLMLDVYKDENALRSDKEAIEKFSSEMMFNNEFREKAFKKYLKEKVIDADPKYKNLNADALAEKAADLINAVDISIGINQLAGIDSGSRLDSRNSAMSAVAVLLGVPDVIAKSEPAVLMNGDEKIQGTFMENASGVDLTNADDTARKYKTDSAVFSDGSAMKSFADLQVLDFICGNVDRHRNNMVYKFDRSSNDPSQHKFIGVQGFDNDCSFGTKPFDTMFEESKNMVKPVQMQVISRSMYDRVTSLTSEMLEFSLHDMGLSRAEIKAAGKRLEYLQKYLDEHKKLDYDEAKFDPSEMSMSITVLPDDAFAKYTCKSFGMMNRMGNMEVRNNYFGYISDFQRAIREPDKKERVFANANESRLSGRSIAKEAAEVQNMIRGLKHVTWKGHTSDNYEAVVKAVEDYHKFLKENKEPFMDQDAILAKNKLLRNIQKTSLTYLEGKGNGRHGWYTRRRINAVIEIADKAQKAEIRELTPSEKKQVREYTDKKTLDFNKEMRRKALEIKEANEKMINVPKIS